MQKPRIIKEEVAVCVCARVHVCGVYAFQIALGRLQATEDATVNRPLAGEEAVIDRGGTSSFWFV